MARLGSTPFSFPEFRGATRRMVLVNLSAYFLLLLMGMALPVQADLLAGAFRFVPSAFLHGWFWQPLTYSLVHPSLLGTLFELLSLWFLAGFLENLHTSNWVMGLYTISVLGTVAAATVIYSCGAALGLSMIEVPLYGCAGGIFGLLVAIGTLYGNMEFLLFFTIGIKARYIVAIYALVSLAMLFGDQKAYAFAQLGGALAGLLWVKMAPRRGFAFPVASISEPWYGLRNKYYRWKRRRTARKFEVYMKKQGRTVRFDGNGRPLHDDPDDKSRWN